MNRWQKMTNGLWAGWPPSHTLRRAARFLGVLSGLIGIVMGGFTFLLDGFVTASHPPEGLVAIYGSVSAVGLSLVGIVGAALAPAMPTLSGCLMLIAGQGGLLIAGWPEILSGPLFTAAAIISFLARAPDGDHAWLDR